MKMKRLKIIFFVIINLLPFDGYSQKIETIQIVDIDLTKVDTLHGDLVTVSWESKFLNEERSITVYQPPYYDRANEYGVLVVTDGMAKYLAAYIEFLILSNEIKPIIIVGLNPREQQSKDSLIINYGIDFRSLEYHKDSEIVSVIPIPDSLVPSDLKNRYDRFASYVQNEVISYISDHYSISKNRAQWTIGGFSNGGGFAALITQDYPNTFGNAIVLSIAITTLPYNFTENSPRYYFAAGKHEDFLGTSLYFAEELEKKNLPFIHYTYDAGHDFPMWVDAYIKMIKLIYKKE
jgi:enterochelin esterase-like enzyme